MTTNDDQVIYSDDYTRLFTYQSRQFTAGDLSLRAINGVQWNAALPAAATAVAVGVVTALGLWLVGISPWWSVLLLPAPLLVVYLRMAKDRAEGLTESEKIRLAWNFRYSQPRDVLGLAENTEPTDFSLGRHLLAATRAAGGGRSTTVTVLIVVVLVVPGILFASYRIQRAREMKKRQNKGAPDHGGGAGSTVTRPRQRRWELRRLGYRYADDTVFVHGTGVFTGVVIDTSTDEFATAGETGDTAMLPVGIYQALLGLFDGEEVRCHELVRYRPITTDGWLDQLLSNAWHPTRMYTILAGKVADHILHSTPQRMWALIIRLGDCPPPTGIDPYAEVSAAVLGVAEDKLTETDLAYLEGIRREPARRARPARRGTVDPPGPALVDPQTRARAPAGPGRTGHPPPTVARRVLRAGRQHPRPQRRGWASSSCCSGTRTPVPTRPATPRRWWSPTNLPGRCSTPAEPGPRSWPGSPFPPRSPGVTA